MSIILIMGIPGAGKSTFRSKMANSAPNLIASTSFDEFRELHSLENARETRKSFQCHVDSELSRTNRPIWLIEDIFYLQSMRRAFQKLAKRRGFQFGVVFLRIDVEEAIGRNLKRREGRQTEETIRRVFGGLEEPVEVENSVILDDAPEDVQGIWDLLRILKIPMTKVPEASEQPTPPPTSSEATPLQDLDVLTRRLVTEIMKSGDFDGRTMSKARKLLLKNQNNSTIPLQNQLIDIYNSLQ